MSQSQEQVKEEQERSMIQAANDMDVSTPGMKEEKQLDSCIHEINEQEKLTDDPQLKYIGLETSKESKVDDKNTPGVRGMKQKAMDRMRNSIKDTLFKGIPKKIYPEGVGSASESQDQKIKQLVSKESLSPLLSFEETKFTNAIAQPIGHSISCNDIQNEEGSSFQLSSILDNSLEIADQEAVKCIIKRSPGGQSVKFHDQSLWNTIVEQ